MIKLGLDVHGVIDDDPDLFADLSRMMFEQGHQVFIVTGREKHKELVDEMVNYHIIKFVLTYQYFHYFHSIINHIINMPNIEIHFH